MPSLECSVRWPVTTAGSGLGGALSPSPMEKAAPTGVLLSGTPSHLVSNRDPQNHDRKMGQALRLGRGPSPPVKDSAILHSPASHALPLSLPEEADPCSLPSPDSSPPVSICPPSLAPMGYITILFPMPASVTWPYPALGSSWSPPPPLSDHTVHAPPHPLPARREQWPGELYLALGNSFTFPDLAF